MAWEGDLEQAHAPLSVTLTLADEIDISRGDMISERSGAGGGAKAIEATMVWFDVKPLDLAGDYLIKHTSQMVPARVEAVEYRVNMNTLHAEAVTSLAMNEVGVVQDFFGAADVHRSLSGESRGGRFHLNRPTDECDGGGRHDRLGGTELRRKAQWTGWCGWCVRPIPSGARLNLPEEDEAAVKKLRSCARDSYKDYVVMSELDQKSLDQRSRSKKP